MSSEYGEVKVRYCDKLSAVDNLDPCALKSHEFSTSITDAPVIEKYASSTKEHYIPRDLELCVAPFEGSWYRGACLMRNATPTSSSIFFVDYGNISQVEHKDLRLMTKDFMTPPALACICNVQNLLPKKYEKDIPKNVEERLANLLAPNALVKVKIINEDAEKNYTIELPETRDILLKEQLI